MLRVGPLELGRGTPVSVRGGATRRVLLPLSGDSLLTLQQRDELRHAALLLLALCVHVALVARIEDEVTVKRFQRTRKRDHIMLLPENDDYDPIDVDLSHQAFAIEGLSVGVIRQQI